MRELIEFNRYFHDFASAAWICGSILILMLMKEALPEKNGAETGKALMGIALRLRWLTLPALAVTLLTGAGRALTFAKYEYVGEITSTLIASLIIKHIFFAAVVGWGIWVHLVLRKRAKSL